MLRTPVLSTLLILIIILFILTEVACHRLPSADSQGIIGSLIGRDFSASSNLSERQANGTVSSIRSSTTIEMSVNTPNTD
jgi:hypothetical protein